MEQMGSGGAGRVLPRGDADDGKEQRRSGGGLDGGGDGGGLDRGCSSAGRRPRRTREERAWASTTSQRALRRRLGHHAHRQVIRMEPDLVEADAIHRIAGSGTPSLGHFVVRPDGRRDTVGPYPLVWNH
uniref:Uncharacterized protein n=1 Tax=Oryza nivara TaxID=4536 RepID=A0A0E0G6G9_ORYNI